MGQEKYEGWLIYREEDLDRNKRFIQLLTEASFHLGISLKVKTLEEIQWKIHHSSEPFSTGKPKFLINRSVSPWLSELAELFHIRVFNHSFVSRIANDKRLTHAYFRQKNIPFLETMVITKCELQAGNLPLPYPFIVKDPLGRGGKGVRKIANKPQLIETLPLLEDELIIQPVAEKAGYDLRVYIVGNQIVAAILRESINKEQEFRANISVGGKASLYVLSDAERKFINQLCEGIQLDFVGLDFLFAENGQLLFNEMEDAVGCRSLYMHSEINIAEIFMEYVKITLDNTIS